MGWVRAGPAGRGGRGGQWGALLIRPWPSQQQGLAGPLPTCPLDSGAGRSLELQLAVLAAHELFFFTTIFRFLTTVDSHRF
jgi:hypothetical protein